MPTMRLPLRIGRPSVLARRCDNSRHALHTNFLHRGAAERLARGQTLAASTSSLVQSSSVHDNRYAFGVSYAVAVGPINLIRLNGSDVSGRTPLCGRSFSSLERVTDYAEASGVDQQIISLAESGDISRAQELLHQTEADAISQNNEETFPDIDSYTALLDAFIDEQRRLISTINDEKKEIESDANATMPNEHGAESNEQGAVSATSLAEKAHDLLVHMEDLSGVSDHYSSMRVSGTIGSELRDASLKPTSHHYDSVILAFANATTAARDANYTSHLTKQAPYLAQRWLGRMETLAFDPQSGVAPTVDTYYHVMEACVASDTVAASSAPNKQSKGAVLAQSVFDKLTENTNIHPTAREYRLLLRAWVGSSGHREAAYKAMGLWQTMQKAFKGGADDMEPTLEDGKMVLEAWTRSINKRSANRAQNVLSAMERLHSTKKMGVDLDCYRYVLTTMSRSKVPDIGWTVPKLFKSMGDHQVHPDTACFDLAIETLRNCARHSNDKDAEKYSIAAENMLEQMEKARDRSSATEIKTSAVSYTNAIQALAERGSKRAADKADVFLTKMESEYARGDETMKPTRDSYVGVIHAYGNCGSDSNFVHANEVLLRMIVQHEGGNEEARPDVSSFHAVIRSCARASENSKSPEKRKEALLLAISTVQYMKKCDTNHPNAGTFALLLQCCASLLPSGPERERALRSIFRSCAKDGLVNQKVLKEFQSSVSTELYHREVVQNAPSHEGIKSLPESWTRSLGYRVRTNDAGADGVRKRSPIISVGGEVIASTAYNDHRMRRRWEKKNQKLLRGGRS